MPNQNDTQTVGFYTAAISELFIAMGSSDDESEIDNIQAEIDRLSTRMRQRAFADIANRTANLRALLADLQRITQDLSGPTFGDHVNTLLGIVTQVAVAMGGDPTIDPLAGDPTIELRPMGGDPTIEPMPMGGDPTIEPQEGDATTDP